MAKKPANLNALLQKATGKEDFSVDDLRDTLRSSGVSGRNTRRLTRAYTRFSKSGRDANIGEGGYEVKEGNVPLNRSSRTSGNLKGKQIGDAFGLGNNMSMLAGFASQYLDSEPELSTKNDKTPTPSSSAPTPPPAAAKTSGAPAKTPGSTSSKGNTSSRTPLNFDLLFELDKIMGKKIDTPQVRLPKSKGFGHDWNKVQTGTLPEEDNKLGIPDPDVNFLIDPQSEESAYYRSREPWSREGIGYGMQDIGDFAGGVGTGGLYTMPLVGSLFKQGSASAKAANKVFLPLSLAGQGYSLLGKGINPNQDINWGDEAVTLGNTIVGGMFNRYLANRPTKFSGAKPQKPYSPKELPPGKTPKTLKSGPTGDLERDKTISEMSERMAEMFSRGGKFNFADGGKIRKYAKGGPMDGLFPQQENGYFLPGSFGETATAPTEQPQQNFGFGNEFELQDPFGGEGFDWQRAGEIGAGAAKYVIPFLATGIANRNIKPRNVSYSPTEFMKGNVYDMARPNFGLGYRTPTGPDALTEILGQKAADNAQRSNEANFENQNAMSRIQQRQQIVEATNQERGYNAGVRGNADYWNARMGMQGDMFKASNTIDAFTGVQHMLASDVAQNAALKAEQESQWAYNILKNPELVGGTDSPEYKQAYSTMMRGGKKGPVGRQLKTKFSGKTASK